MKSIVIIGCVITLALACGKHGFADYQSNSNELPVAQGRIVYVWGTKVAEYDLANEAHRVLYRHATPLDYVTKVDDASFIVSEEMTRQMLLISDGEVHRLGEGLNPVYVASEKKLLFFRPIERDTDTLHDIQIAYLYHAELHNESLTNLQKASDIPLTKFALALSDSRVLVLLENWQHAEYDLQSNKLTRLPIVMRPIEQLCSIMSWRSRTEEFVCLTVDMENPRRNIFDGNQYYLVDYENRRRPLNIANIPIEEEGQAGQNEILDTTSYIFTPTYISQKDYVFVSAVRYEGDSYLEIIMDLFVYDYKTEILNKVVSNEREIVILQGTPHYWSDSVRKPPTWEEDAMDGSILYVSSLLPEERVMEYDLVSSEKKVLYKQTKKHSGISKLEKVSKKSFIYEQSGNMFLVAQGQKHPLGAGHSPTFFSKYGKVLYMQIRQEETENHDEQGHHASLMEAELNDFQLVSPRKINVSLTGDFNIFKLSADTLLVEKPDGQYMKYNLETNTLSELPITRTECDVKSWRSRTEEFVCADQTEKADHFLINLQGQKRPLNLNSATAEGKEHYEEKYEFTRTYIPTKDIALIKKSSWRTKFGDLYAYEFATGNIRHIARGPSFSPTYYWFPNN